MNQHLWVSNNGAELYTESFGERNDPALLLIMGAQSSMVWWDEAFCRRLADAGRFVIRYDNRDVGESTAYEPGQPGYTFVDMADDAIAVLDAYGIEKACIAGMSMGGMLTQMIALRHPDRVSGIVLIATSNFAPDLPPMEEKVMSFFASMGEVDWNDERSVADFSVAKWNVLRGSKHAFEENRIRELALLELRRSRRPASMTNHAFVAGGEEYLARTSEIAVPALVIHGTEDPIIPYAHGRSLATVIPGAILLTLEGTGHELHQGDWDVMIEAILRHSASPGSHSEIGI
ncbi:alpha/beta fold hydrolase [Paenibacillus soyae]|uniref:Alpha/beta fold hydrolase n=1 Tax=Paenibacillus soyae TaxID=2969249 RepID=A0A9X2S9L1_9BACL|nr:alpha/beta hydrolase [Paenibacillus soyae]MCR2805251.1 alpha/beta fold hydrolase [Paenibacillus soyae]